MDKREIMQKIDDLEAEMVFSLYMFIKNYKYQEKPEHIFQYVSSQWKHIREKIDTIL
jgi:hypothetical protein